MLVLLASSQARAAFGACSPAQENMPVPQLDHEVVMAHRLFAPPVLSYPHGTHAGSTWGVMLELRIDAAGRVVCYTKSMRSEGDLPDPPLRTALGEVAHWRYQPMIQDGKPVPMSDWVAIREQELPERHVPLPAVAPDAITISDERGPCFGSCPIYSVVVHGNGNVDYEGIANVKVKGKHSWRITPAATARLVDAARDDDLWSMRSDYSASITDCPTETLTIQAGAQAHKIIDYVGVMAGMPKSVSDFEKLLWETSGVRQRVEGESTPP